MAASSVSSAMCQSACTPMSHRAALTMRERSVVSSVVELSSDSRENGTWNSPTVPPQLS